jgi:hypothetical protein
LYSESGGGAIESFSCCVVFMLVKNDIWSDWWVGVMHCLCWSAKFCIQNSSDQIEDCPIIYIHACPTPVKYRVPRPKCNSENCV